MRDVSRQKVLITGATGGLGQQVATELARLGAAVVIHGRDPERAAATRDKVAAEAPDGTRIDTAVADLASIADVRRLAAEVADRHSDLTILVNNAGVGFGVPGEGRQVSRDGIELRFAVNYLASHLLARELLPTLTRNAPARIVNVASIGQASFVDDPLVERDYDGVRAYRQSKLAMIADTFALAAETAGTGVTVNALHPATLMPTGMVVEAGWNTMDSVDTGTRSTLRLIVDPELDGVTGHYFDKLERAEPQPEARDPRAQAALAELTARLLAR
ncbi:SDR family NAD(P)-dependent oxidoreductase [Fodinicola acaciae]|uniref:SDR family NAD(P)-dependent oxidoreductase n=1 Tax=Fodinicola acaciae TaxID=2681555 RepID=UPI0013CF64ED|nr:SDR family NAD(P)-dependent oxidoreductase [Fodinicola acaciae]